jgi:hypothetical protein
MATPARPGRDRKSAKRGPGKRIVEGGSIRLADEVRYIQQRAANHDGRIVTIGQLIPVLDRNRRCNGPAFVYSDRDTGRVITVLGYPTDKLVGIK